MSRYIDVDDAIKALSKHIDYDDDGMQEIDTDTIFITLEELPSADVVEVIRCKECKYYIDYINMQFVNAPTLCGRLSTLDNYVTINANDFCSWGERTE